MSGEDFPGARMNSEIEEATLGRSIRRRRGPHPHDIVTDRPVEGHEQFNIIDV